MTAKALSIAFYRVRHLLVGLVSKLPQTATRDAVAERQGGAEYQLVLDGATVATGGLLFHDNLPYTDIYMETVESFRHRGFGPYLVQELKRCGYALGSIPCARCSPDNAASRSTLQKAGLVPFAHILNGSKRLGSIHVVQLSTSECSTQNSTNWLT